LPTCALSGGYAMNRRRLICPQQHEEAATRRVFLKQVVAGTGLLVSLKHSHALARITTSSEYSEKGPPGTGSAMATASEAFLNSLSPEQRAIAILPFEDDQRQDWHYIPKPRKGVPYKQLGEAQTQLANALLSTGLSQRGLRKASTIISLEPILREIEQGHGPVRDSELYYFCVFGKPQASRPWGWSIEGHHLSLNYTVIEDSVVASTPSFLGANPAEVQHGPRQGLRTLASEEDIARTLLKSLDDRQRTQAVVSESAPGDILSANSRKAGPIKPAGLQANGLTGQQAEVLMNLLNEYAENMAADIAAARMGKLRSAGFNNIHFAWAGGFEHGQPHYYRIQGPTFLIEYDNIQDNANHIHSVWRDFNGDFGVDLLAEHYENAHR
jgi:Protein of unknown function (DUF3500)